MGYKISYKIHIKTFINPSLSNNMMGGKALPLWASTKENLDKLRTALQDYLCDAWGKCSITEVPNSVIIDALVDFCLYKAPDVLFQATSEWLKRKGDKTGEKLTTVWAKDVTVRKLDELRDRIIGVFLEKARDIDLSSQPQVDELREDLRSILTYARLFDIILNIFDVGKFVEEVAAIKKNRGSKVSPAYYRFINMVVEKAGSAIATSDPYTRVMSFLKRVEDEETKRRRAEALNRRAMELLQRLEGKPIRTTLRIGHDGWNYLAVPKDIDILRNLSTIIHANVVGENSRLVADMEFTLEGKSFYLKDLWILEYVSTKVEHLIPPGWWSGGLPLIIMGSERELPPDLKSILDPVVKPLIDPARPNPVVKPPSSIDVEATIRIHRVPY
jgi:hypothetical protein